MENSFHYSLFVPKNQTEETLLLLLIAESMVSIKTFQPEPIYHMLQMYKKSVRTDSQVDN